jgi:predicted transposase YbfD/YdcC
MSDARRHYVLDLLAQIPDPRRRRGRRHPLAGLLAVGIAAVIAGSRSFAAIGQWAAEARPEVLAVLGAARRSADESTFRRSFALVSADMLDQVLGAWLWTRASRPGSRLVIAIDGKTVRGAKGKDGKAPHLVAALAHGMGAVLGQVAVDLKSNEIRSQIASVSSVSRGHGRRARRTIKVARAPAWTGFDGAAQVAQLRRTVTKKGKKTVEVVYLITSDRSVSPETFAAWVRRHWHIGNKLHWVRDVTYQEDKSLVTTGNAPRVMASLRSLAISILRLDSQGTSPPPTATTPATRSERSSYFKLHECDFAGPLPPG